MKRSVCFGSILTIAFLLLITVYAHAVIPTTEREALIALYHSTNGDSWTNNSGWKEPPLDADGFAMPGTENTWYGIICTGGNTTVFYVDLRDNNLSGTIPPELGNLANLGGLGLSDNQLTGTIPPELGNLANLWGLYLFGNQLTGSIPPELGNLANLWEFHLDGNQLTGPIPTSLSNLTNLTYAKLGYNALYANDDTLRAFLDSVSPGWGLTQTIAPEDIAVAPLSDTSIRVNWTPLTYTSDSGGYRVFYSTTSGGPYALFDTTADKTYAEMSVTGLDPDNIYYFVVQTRTNPHLYNQNTVDSEYSKEVAATTSICEGDFEPDGDVDGSDLAVFAADFGRTDCDSAPPCEGDFDHDNDVDGSDLAVFAADFGRTDCP